MKANGFIPTLFHLSKCKKRVVFRVGLWTLFLLFSFQCFFGSGYFNLETLLPHGRKAKFFFVKLPSDIKALKGWKPLKAIYLVKLQISLVKLQLKVFSVLALTAFFWPFGLFQCRQSWTRFFLAIWDLFLAAASSEVKTLK